MSNSKIWLSPPHMGGTEEMYIHEAFGDNWIAPLGPNVDAFEQGLEKYLGNGVHVAVLSSGTAALHLGLLLLGVGRGDEVLCQSFTFSASANPIVYCGATPVFVDSEPDSWNICPDALEAAIKTCIARGKKPKAIIAVHLYGMPYKHDAIKAVSDKYNIPVIEDAAEALGSSYKGQPCGTLGDISVLSFNGNKIITTSGGGALAVKNAKLKQEAVFLATQARDKAPHYEHSRIGYNYRMSNICAGIGRGQLEVLDKRVSKKREINNFYKELFTAIPGVSVFNEYTANVKSNYWLTTIVLDDSNANVYGLINALAAENIEARPLWKPMHTQPVFKEAAYYGGNVSESLFNRGVCLPSGTAMAADEMYRISATIKRYFKEIA
ncbi:DegT/DnrJ/EryC1/StrS family aminotransferase [Flavobacterium sp. RHBU_24]|uniref:DegT/DnrJ/EryC1/StrS family aminotransferase n=1 Tax=Flavobacterium sp. RHBU_24 TaxID=3391185 RepID=UPI0039847119